MKENTFVGTNLPKKKKEVREKESLKAETIKYNRSPINVFSFILKVHIIFFGWNNWQDYFSRRSITTLTIINQSDRVSNDVLTNNSFGSVHSNDKK